MSGKDKIIYIAEGAREDCEELLKRFASKSSVRFQEFVEVWQEMGFSYIFCGRSSFRELYEFIEDILQIAKEYIFPPYPYRTRIGGMYLLYGLYFKQPLTSRLLPIRVDLNEWKELITFVRKLVKDEHFDTFYAFRKLFELHAFTFEASSVQYGFDKTTRTKLVKNAGQAQKFDPMKYGLELFDEIDFFNEWSKHESLYRSLKTQAGFSSDSFIPKDWPVEVLHSVASSSTSGPVNSARKPIGPFDENDGLNTAIGYRRLKHKNRNVSAYVSASKESLRARRKKKPRKKKTVLQDPVLSSGSEADANEGPTPSVLPILETTNEV